MLLEAAVDVEVEGELIVLVEVLPCAVVVDFEVVVSGVGVLPDIIFPKENINNKYQLSIHLFGREHYNSV